MGANELEAVIEAARKEALELRQNLRDIEKARLDAHHGRHELRRHLKSLDAERTRLANELEDAPVLIGTTKSATNRRAASPSASSRSSPDKTRATGRCTRSSCR